LLTLRGIGMSVRRMMLVALLFLGLLYAIVPGMRSLVNGLVLGGKDRVEALFASNDVPIRPISTAATAEVPRHGAGLATDLGENTFWAAPNAAAKPKLVLGFDAPTRLTQAIVHNGDGAGEFQALGRPQDLHLVFFDRSNTVLGTDDVHLEDKPDSQQVALEGADGATRVEIQVMSVYPAPGNPGLALSEIELFQHR
jgi:hypothetical protein